METLTEKIKLFCGDGDGSGSGSGYGSGYGSGDGDGSGSGHGSGSGSGSGYGSGYGSGSGSGYGSGSGHGSGSGSGYGSGSGSGYGSGSGHGSGIKSVNGLTCVRIDGILTVITMVKGSAAKGFMVRDDLTMRPCFVAKSGNTFAHGHTLRDAMSSLRDKLFDEMSERDRISAFVASHKPNTPYPNKDLFDWHHKLTGSCLAGRNEFVSQHGIDLGGETTPEEFIRLTEHAYGGDVIRKLKEFYP